MNLVELQRALRQLRLGGMAAVLEARLLEAQSDRVVPIDLVSTLVTDELTRRGDRLLHHGHVIKCGPRSWRTKNQGNLHQQEATS